MDHPAESDVVAEAESIMQLREVLREELVLTQLDRDPAIGHRPDWATVEEWDELRAAAEEAERRAGL
ncbi:hypothetical protein [uncultured Brachybacterium sp.]|uniref:hypothetical protein n=1 Tax=uncultured Brachybacterium sp. TaxID=189680 RepID=UPI00262201E2|nr:hypothetical protein [uncultured Brachybacterium sp.]